MPNPQPAQTATEPGFSLPQIFSGIVTGIGMLVAILMLTARPYAPLILLENIWLQVLLLGGSWLVAFALIRERVSPDSIPWWIHCVCGLAAGAALTAWSCTIPLALATGAPILITVVAGSAGNLSNWHWIDTGNFRTVSSELVVTSTRQDDAGQSTPATIVPETEEPTDNQEPNLVASAAELAPGDGGQSSEVESSEMELSSDLPGNHEEDLEDAEGDLWRSVQREFSSDDALIQNLTRWETPDGQQTIVVNMRWSLPRSGSTNINVPVWPFLNSDPEIYCSVVAGPPAEVRVIHSRPNGIVAQVDFTDSGSPPDDDLIIEIIAVSQAAQQSSPAA